MKSVKLILFSAMFVLLTGNLFSQTQTRPPGTGTQSDPYLISTINHLAWMSENSAAWWLSPTTSVFFKQIADIDASVTTNWNSGAGFRPIGHQATVNGQSGRHFVGEYDGQHYTISNLFINRSGSDDRAGFFNEVTGINENTRSVVRNLKLVNANIKNGAGNPSYVGGIAARVRNAVISNCSTTGTIGNSLSITIIAGGIAGDIRSNTLIKFSYSLANVTALGGVASYAGGLVGYASSDNTGTDAGIRDSYSRGNVRAEGQPVFSNFGAGGIVGRIENNNSSIERCYATGRVELSRVCP